MRFGGLIAAIVLAAVAAIIVLRMSGGEERGPKPGESAPQAVATTDVYVAAQAIPVGTPLTAEMVQVQPWPAHLVLPGFVTVESGQQVVGMVTRSPFQQQEPILLTKLSNVNDPSFLAGALPKGMRVITLQTNEIEGVAGFVFPGDYVDVMITREVIKWVKKPAFDEKAAAAPALERQDSITETLLTNVKVLAVDQRAGASPNTDKDGKLIIPRSISLMVSPTDAQRLRLGQKKGTLTLALRSLADRESADPLTLTVNQDISQFPDPYGEATTGNGAPGAVVVVRGTEVKKSEGGYIAPSRAEIQTAAPASEPPAPAATAPATEQ